MNMVKKIFILFLIVIPFNSYALIEVDITRGNLDPLPVAISPLSIDEKSRKSFEKVLKKENIGEEISSIVSSISAAATSISNVGPGLGSVIGSNGNFSTLPDASKWILSAGMILGRLELFAILVLFLPSFWKK